MLTVMTWNLENLERPAAGADPEDTAAYGSKLSDIAAVVQGAGPDLLAVQEVLAAPDDLDPPVFADLQAALGGDWHGVLSQRPDTRGIRVGWLSRHRLDDPTDVADFPAKVPPVTVDDHGRLATSARRGGLAVRFSREDGLQLDALALHLKSKLLSFPGHDPQHPQFDTHDEGERARYGLYALDMRAAEAATARAWATATLRNNGQQRHVLVCGDLNDTPQAATTQILLGRPGSQLGTGGYDQDDWGDGNRLFNLAPAMPAGDPAAGEPAANWSRINNGVPELIDQMLVSHLMVHALASTESLPIDGIRSVTADPRSLAGMKAPSDHRPVVARFNL